MFSKFIFESLYHPMKFYRLGLHKLIHGVKKTITLSCNTDRVSVNSLGRT
jgi:hypothetical protein